MTAREGMASVGARWPLWLMVMSASLIVFFGMGTRNTFGLFLDPISESMTWGREIFSLTLAPQNIIWGVTQPIAGAIADRYGAGRVMALGGVLYAVGILAISFSGVPIAMHLAGGVLIGIAQGLASMNIGMAVVARSTPVHRRTLVMSVVTMGGSAGQMVLSPLAQSFIEGYGWVTALVFISIMVLIVVPLAIPLSGKPVATPGSTQTFGAALREASGHPGYMLLVAGFFVCGFHVTFIGTHLPGFVAAARAFDLYDVRAKQRQLKRGVGSGNDAGEVDYAKSFERLRSRAHERFQSKRGRDILPAETSVRQGDIEYGSA